MSGPYSARDVAGYVVRHREVQGDTVTPLQLMKIVYIAHGWMLGQRGRPLVSDTFTAWRYGPAAEDLYAAVRRFGSSPVKEVNRAKPIEPDESEKEVLERVTDYYAKFDGIRLSALTHAPGSPWDKTTKTAGLNSSIPNDLIENYYSKLANKAA